MYLKIFIVAVAMTIFFNARAEEKFSSLKIGSEIYSNVTVTSVSATDIFFTHSRGMGNAKLKDLDPDLQKHFHYDAAKADAIAKKRADDNAQYHKQLISEPQAKPPDESRKVVHASDLLWGADLNAALVKAHLENKKVLLDFTGSDWSDNCKKFDAEVFSTDSFAAYAQAKLVLLRLDFPHNIQQSENLKINNNNIANHFNINAFPTLLLLNSDGQELGREVGYVPGGPDAFIALLEKMSNR
jgi:thioredoxin-related protein